MGGQQYQESAFARLDQCDAKIKEHERTCSNIRGMRAILEKADAKINSLEMQVVRMGAVIESLQKMVAMQGGSNCNMKGVVVKQDSESTIEWGGVLKLMPILKFKYPNEIWNKTHFGRAMMAIGYCVEIGRRDRCSVGHYIPTEKGMESGLVSTTKAKNQLLYNLNRYDEIADIVIKYKKLYNNFMSEAMGGDNDD